MSYVREVTGFDDIVGLLFLCFLDVHNPFLFVGFSFNMGQERWTGRNTWAHFVPHLPGINVQFTSTTLMIMCNNLKFFSFVKMEMYKTLLFHSVK